jgi:hypothetical protein
MASLSYSVFAKRSQSLKSLKVGNLRVVWELSQLVLDCEQISGLVRNEFVQVDQAVEENPDLLFVLLQVLQAKMSLSFAGLDHVVQLTKQVDKKDGFVVQVLQPVRLFFIKVLHLLRRDYPVVVQIDNLEPVLESLRGRLVLLTKHEVNKVLIAHLASSLALESPRDLLEDAVNCFAGECVPLVPREVLLVDDEVVVGVKLPEAAVQHIEMFVAEELPDFVDVVLSGHLVQHIEQRRILEVAESYLAVIICVQNEENAHHDRFRVPFLELGRGLKELQAWVFL